MDIRKILRASIFSRETTIYWDKNHKHVFTQKKIGKISLCNVMGIEVEKLQLYAWNWHFKKLLPKKFGCPFFFPSLLEEICYWLRAASLHCSGLNPGRGRWQSCQWLTLVKWTWEKHILTVPMLRLLLSKAPGCKDFLKPFKPCHVGIH